MCRLFGMNAGSQPAKASFWLLQAPDSLAEQSHREPDGTGLGWYSSDGAPHISKQPIAAYDDRRFAREAREVSSRTFLAHVRFASTGELLLKNTHPFEQHGRLFAHNGVIEDLPALERQLGSDLSLVQGDTDSERFFALITREAAAAGDLAAGIEAACSWVAANLPIYAINFVLILDGELWALRYPDTHPLYLLQREAGSPLEQASSLGTRVHSSEGEQRPFTVVASEEMDADPGWRELSSGELVHVDSELRLERGVILPGAPAHLLALEDLGARAQASQAHTAPPPG